jgi:hypothetical protein
MAIVHRSMMRDSWWLVSLRQTSNAVEAAVIYYGAGAKG